MDVFFPLVHGPLGEDGTLQGLLDMAGRAYVGAGVAASAVGMDKSLMKAAFQAAGLPQVEYRVVSSARWPLRACGGHGGDRAVPRVPVLRQAGQLRLQRRHFPGGG